MTRRGSPGLLGRYLSADRGAAAVEFAIWLTVLVPTTLSAADISVYVYDTTQVYAAAQAAAQSARSTAITGQCDFSGGQALSSCTGLSSAATTAMSQSGSLGGSMTKNSEALHYYCSNNGTASAGGLGTSSAGCSNTGYYYDVKVHLPYSPLFAGVGVTSLLTGGSASCPASTICQEAVLRLQ